VKMHKDHEVDLIVERASTEKAILIDRTQDALPKEEALRDAIEKIRLVIEGLSFNGKKAEEELRCRVEALHALLDEHLQMLLLTLASALNRKIANLNGQQKTLQGLLEQHICLRELIQTALEVGSDTEILEFKKQFLKQMAENCDMTEKQPLQPVENAAVAFVVREEDECLGSVIGQHVGEIRAEHMSSRDEVGKKEQEKEMSGIMEIDLSPPGIASAACLDGILRGYRMDVWAQPPLLHSVEMLLSLPEGETGRAVLCRGSVTIEGSVFHGSGKEKQWYRSYFESGCLIDNGSILLCKGSGGSFWYAESKDLLSRPVFRGIFAQNVKGEPPQPHYYGLFMKLSINQ